MTIAISVHIHGLDQLSRRYAQSQVTRAADQGLAAALLQTEAEAKDSATNTIYRRPETGRKRTGAYRASLGQGGAGNVRQLRTGYAAFGSRLFYASYLEGGTKAHTIRPRTKKALAFPGRGGGIVVRRVVHHPGTRAYHVLRSAARFGKPRIVGAFRRAFWQSLRGL